MGLRELKKARTRKAISDLATRLFMERGYDDVTVAEIAQQAEVAVTTLFNYFPTKESLLFDEEAQREAELVKAVKSRKKGRPILDALEEHLANSPMFKAGMQEDVQKFKNLIFSTPALMRYAKEMWLRYEGALAKAIQEEAHDLSSDEAQIIAHFVLDSFHRAMHSPRPRALLKLSFDILRKGWSG